MCVFEGHRVPDELNNSYYFIFSQTSWISEDDFYRPSRGESSRSTADTNGFGPEGASEGPAPGLISALDLERLSVPSSDTGKPKMSPEREQKGFSVVHRRQMGTCHLCCPGRCSRWERALWRAGGSCWQHWEPQKALLSPGKLWWEAF